VFGDLFRRLAREWSVYATLGVGCFLWSLLVASLGVSLFLLLSFLLTWLAGRLNLVGPLLPVWVFGALLLLFLCGALTQAGMVGSLLEWRQGKGVSLPRYFDWGVRYGRRFLGLWGYNGLLVGGGALPVALAFALLTGRAGARLTAFLQLYLLLVPLLLAFLWAQGVTGGILILRDGESADGAFRRLWSGLGRNLGTTLFTLTIDLSLYLLLIPPLLVLLLPRIGFLLAVPLFALLLAVVTDGLVDRFERFLAPFFP
jgi:hypothetical protein